MLAKLQRYVDACYLATIEEVTAYDIKVGYPAQLEF